jgi:hypothetical protein
VTCPRPRSTPSTPCPSSTSVSPTASRAPSTPRVSRRGDVRVTPRPSPLLHCLVTLLVSDCRRHCHRGQVTQSDTAIDTLRPSPLRHKACRGVVFRTPANPTSCPCPFRQARRHQLAQEPCPAPARHLQGRQARQPRRRRRPRCEGGQGLRPKAESLRLE